MARLIDRQRAIALRKEGWSYSQIKNFLKVGKGTLSEWLKGYPLAEARLRELRDWNAIRIEKYRETRRKQREEKYKEIYCSQEKTIFPISRRDLFIAGLFLYWGEGTKNRYNTLVLANTDPSMTKFFVHWLEKIFRIPRAKIKICLHLYNDMVINKETQFWSTALNIPKEQFLKPYIKTTTLAGLSRRGGFGHGTCSVKVDDAHLAQRILLGVKVIRDRFYEL